MSAPLTESESWMTPEMVTLERLDNIIDGCMNASDLLAFFDERYARLAAQPTAQAQDASDEERSDTHLWRHGKCTVCGASVRERDAAISACAAPDADLPPVPKLVAAGQFATLVADADHWSARARQQRDGWAAERAARLREREEHAKALADARRTAQHWKDEHLAGNERIATLEARLAAPDAPGFDAWVTRDVNRRMDLWAKAAPVFESDGIWACCDGGVFLARIDPTADALLGDARGAGAIRRVRIVAAGEMGDE